MYKRTKILDHSSIVGSTAGGSPMDDKIHKKIKRVIKGKMSAQNYTPLFNAEDESIVFELRIF